MSASREEVFRAAVGRIAADPTGFLASGELTGFMVDIHQELIPTALRIAERLGHPYRTADREDLANFILVALISSPDKCRYLAENAVSPFSYARTFLPIWLGVETGRRHGETSVLIDWVDHPSLVLPTSSYQDPTERMERQGATVDEAVALTARALIPRTPVELGRYVTDIVDWMADNAPTHSGHEGEKLELAAECFPLVSRVELQAIGNITWGGRGRERETSLLGAFLLNRMFDPRASATHRMALRLYASRVRQPRVLAGLAG